jgi:Ran GTPase-activating protein (RanGAP) involved in mRNA processing and transport
MSNSQLRQLIIEYNSLGENEYDDWPSTLGKLMELCPKMERLNISNNKIGSEGFKRLAAFIANSRSLKLVEMRYNNIGSGDAEYLAG